MKKLTFCISLIILSSIYSFGADNYEVGDTLFIWSKNGLNLRSSPGINFKILEVLNFGDELHIESKTNRNHNVIGLSETNEFGKNVDSLVFEGNWVKVKTKTGIEGYVIDQYLLSVKPNEKDKTFLYDINLEVCQVDTTSNDSKYDVNRLNYTVMKTYVKGIKSFESSGEAWGESIFLIPDYSIEEVLVLLSASFHDYANFKVLRDRKEGLVLTDNELCEFVISKEEGKIRVQIFCAC